MDAEVQLADIAGGDVLGSSAGVIVGISLHRRQTIYREEEKLNSSPWCVIVDEGVVLMGKMPSPFLSCTKVVVMYFVKHLCVARSKINLGISHLFLFIYFCFPKQKF